MNLLVNRFSLHALNVAIEAGVSSCETPKTVTWLLCILTLAGLPASSTRDLALESLCSMRTNLHLSVHFGLKQICLSPTRTLHSMTYPTPPPIFAAYYLPCPPGVAVATVTAKVMVDLLLLFGGYAMVFLVSPKRNAATGTPGSLARSTGRSHSQVPYYVRKCKERLLFNRNVKRSLLLRT